MEMYECEVDSDSALNPNTGAGSSRRVTATLELPGMKKEALRIEVRNGQLVIQGDRLPPAHMHTHAKRRRLPLHSATVLSGPGVPPPAPADSHMELHDTCRAAFSEIRYGRFRRVLTLPLGLDVSQHSLRH
jgi:HSP20 family molecular chaperone IbpA